MTRRRIVLYGDVNLNVLDGSATWLVSLAETLTRTDSVIHLVLNAHVKTDRLLTRLSDNPQVVIHPPVTRPGYSVMSQAEAVARLEGIVQELGASILIIRGREVCATAARSKILSERLWSYVTDFTFPATAMSPEQLAQLREIAQRSHRVFAQTEETRAYIEAIIPAAAGKCLLMTPTIPDDFFVTLEVRGYERPLKLVYSGKLHPDWKTLRSMELPSRLAAAGCESTLTIIGDKLYSPDPQWITDMQSALNDPPPHVTWAGGVPREEALRIIAEHDVGLSWRSSALNSNLEISTKMLEYAASGVPPLLNRTPAHEALFGRGYPLFVDETIESVVNVVRECRAHLSALRAAAQSAVRPYASSATAHRLEGYFRRSEAARDMQSSRAGENEDPTRRLDLTAGSLLLDVQDFNRPKHPGAEFSIGMMRFVPFATRPDQALDLLEKLLEHDTRFCLRLMGPLPWDCPAVWESWEERQQYLTFFDRIGTTPGLLEHVVFDPPRLDTANWLRNTAFIFATSGHGCTDLGMAQAMASGAIPLGLSLPGGSTPVRDEFVIPTIEAMSMFVLQQVNSDASRATYARAARDRAAVWAAAIEASTTPPEPE